MEKNANYNNGIEYAIKQMYADKNEAIQMANEIRKKHNDKANADFLNGYYKALLYFTHAISHFNDNPKHLEEKIKRIEEEQGEEIKNVFVMGLEYYKNQAEKIESDEKKK